MPTLPNELPAYTALDVAKHNTADDAWLIIGGKVYDVTHFAQEHPGGDDVLFDAAGRDASREFEDVGHSAEARAQLEKLIIGTVRPATDEELRLIKKSKSDAHKRAAKGYAEDAAKWLRSNAYPIRQASVISVVVLLAAYIAKRYIAPSVASSTKR